MTPFWNNLHQVR